MNASTWIPIVISCVMAIIALITLANTNKKDQRQEAEQRASMTADMRYIRSAVDEIKVDNRVVQKDVSDLKVKVVEIDQRVKSAHQRLDDMQPQGR